jgi:hypothetical protein
VKDNWSDRECTCGGKGDDRFIHGPAYCGGRFVETPVSPPGQRGDARNAAEQAVVDAARAWEKAGPWGLYCAKELRALIAAVRALDAEEGER